MRHIGAFRHNMDPPPAMNSGVVIRTERGVELGKVLAIVSEEAGWGRIHPNRLEEFLKANGSDYPFRRGGKVLRAANPQDVIDYRHLCSSAREEKAYCTQEIRRLKLDMKIVSVEHLLGGERIIFYFTSENRVDFRELVRHMAGEYRTRIEMRQVGARDEARLVADYERCGQRCCCQQYLKDLKPVSMRMAKTQKATLDPSKISGRCGRLMCCLRYEDESYETLRKKLPKRNKWVRTEEGKVGKVIDTHIITQLVRLLLVDRTTVVVPNESIVERDVPVPDAPQESSRPPRPQRPPRHERSKLLLRDQTAEPAEPAPAEAGAVEEGPADEAQAAAEGAGEAPRKKRRRRKRKPSGGSQAADRQDGGDAPGASSARRSSEASEQGDKPRKKRRRRRRKKKDGGSPGSD